MLEIAKEDVVARMQFDNPWWEGDCTVPFDDVPRRLYFESFFSFVTNKHVKRATVLMGPRRVGKTVMVYQAIGKLIKDGVDPKAIFYVSLETPIYTGMSLERLLNLFQEILGHKRTDALYVFYDEVQYLRDWEVHLKSLVDSYPTYRFVATGSAAAALRLKSTESGAGRFTDYVLPPLTFAEYLMFIGRDTALIDIKADDDNDPHRDPNDCYQATSIDELNAEFVNYLNFGGYPEAVFSPEIRSRPEQYIKSDIIDKVLLRDLPSLYGISDIQELNRLFTTLAYNSGNEVSLDQLARASGVAKNTIRRYLDYLEAAFLIVRVERIDYNSKRFKRAMCFKVYLTNPSMRAALFGSIDAASNAMGPLTETAIFSQWQHANMSSLYYARWSTGEVDLVCIDTRNQTAFWAVEVKWSNRPFRIHSELDNCVAFVKANPSIMQPILITTRTVSADAIQYKNVTFAFRPSSLYAYTLGANLLKEKRADPFALRADHFSP